MVAYLLDGGDDFWDRNTLPDAWDIFFGVTLIALILEAMRRTSGWIMPVVSLAFLAYAFVGAWLPGHWTHSGYDVGRLVGLMYMTLEGIFGIAVDVSSSLIILFTIYGAFLQHSGAGKFFLDCSFAAMGGKPSGAGPHRRPRVVPAGRAVGDRRGDHRDDRLGRLSRCSRGPATARTPPAGSWRRAASAPSSRRRCWARPPS